jgi:hypothetical protein
VDINLNFALLEERIAKDTENPIEFKNFEQEYEFDSDEEIIE